MTPQAPPLPFDVERLNAAILIQRLIRGRAIQNNWHAGKDAKLSLIRVSSQAVHFLELCVSLVPAAKIIKCACVA